MYKAIYISPLGPLVIAADSEGLTSIKFGRKRGNSQNNKYIKDTVKQLNDYFSGYRKDFDMKLHIEGSSFELKIWKTLMKTKFGKTITYGELARKAGYPGAARAVGTAMNKNKLAIIVPCHRVVGISNRYLYGAGPSKKKWLLNHES